MNTAARLEQAAPTNEVLLGDATYRLVRHAVEVEPVEPLELKGKAERVPAYRLLSVREAESVERRHDSPLVGRDREVAFLEAELQSATNDRACRLVTIVAQAGVGKSRLIEEVGHRADGARLVRGRCLPYGRGITFWPLVEIVRELAAIRDEDSPEQARVKLRELLGPDADDVVARVASAVGLEEAGFPLDELFWGTRKFFELVATERPLVVAFEDIHWAEQAFLDLIDHVATTSTGAPLLIMCATRPDLFEHRADWRHHHERVIELEPLSEEDSALVVGHLLGDSVLPADAQARIVAAAEGNPLFVEQLLSMLIDDGLLRKEEGRWVPTGDLSQLAIPGTIQALLTARLDLLSPQERAVIEPASVIGLLFEQAAVEELVPDPVRTEVDGHLGSMTQKQLLRPQPEHELGDFRFHHILVRDAAYQGILKRARAGLHERFADWAERINRDRNRQNLEQAHQYLSELGPLDEHGLELGRRASSHLASAGRRAFARGDMGAAANLLRRAVLLFPERAPERLALLPSLGEAMMETGEFAWAEVFLEEAVEGATAIADERLRADAVLTRLLARHHVAADLSAWRDEVEQTTVELIPRLLELDAHTELAKAWRMVAWVHAPVYRWQAAASAQQRALEHAGLAGDRRMEARMSSTYAQSLCAGPTPVPVAIAACNEMLARDVGHRQSEAIILNSLALLLGLDGEFERARSLCHQAQAMLEDLGASVLAASISLYLAQIELLAGSPEAAETTLRNAYKRLEAMGEVFFRTSVGAMLAQALYAQGFQDEAEVLALESQRLAAEGDIEVESICRSIRGKVLAQAGEFVEATRLAEEAVALIPGVEAPLMRTEALIDLAEVYAAAGDVRRAYAALEEARDLAEIKEMTVPLARVSTLLDGLSREPAQPVS